MNEEKESRMQDGRVIKLYKSLFGCILEQDIHLSLIYQDPSGFCLFLGRISDALATENLKRLNILRVLSLADLDGKIKAKYKAETQIVIRKYEQVHDSDDQDLYQYFEDSYEFIMSAFKQRSNILVHCAAGVSRSATIVIAFLMRHRSLSVEDSCRIVKEARPCICPNVGFLTQLVKFERDMKFVC